MSYDEEYNDQVLFLLCCKYNLKNPNTHWNPHSDHILILGHAYACVKSEWNYIMALMLTMNYLQNIDFIIALYVFIFFPRNFFWKLKKIGLIFDSKLLLKYLFEHILTQ